VINMDMLEFWIWHLLLLKMMLNLLHL